jgi:hypothetical protein
MTLVDRTLRRQLTAAMALAMALALLLSGTALAQTPDAVDVDTACEGAPESDFTDIAGNTFEDLIECLAWYEITLGTGDGTTYEPSAGVRRWNMAVFIHRVAMFAEEQDVIDLPDPSDQGFTDIDELSDEAQDAINVLAEVGVVKGKTATTFDPFTNIRRDQMASFINRLQDALGDSFDSSEDFFDDVPSSNVHRANINALAGEGIVQGKTNGDYDPHERVTRGQMSAFIMRHIEVNVDDGLLEPKTADGGGDVTLNESNAMAGGTITGSVDDAATVDSIAVSGCGFNNDTVDLEEDGTFELTIPVEQTAGDCDLTFTVLRSDGTSEDTVIPFAVTAAPQEFTGAPDLVSATVNGDVVTYTFDEDADGAPIDPTDFRIYDAGGASDSATNAEVSGTDAAKIIADFDGATVDAEDATVATIVDQAVEDAAGLQSYPSAAALSAQTAEAGITDGPDLESVTNVRVSGTNIVADFRFDEAVDVTETVPGTFDNIDPTLFQLHSNDGEGDAGAESPFVGTDVNDVSADERTVEIIFGGAPQDLPITAVTRGAVDDSAVADDDGDTNVPQSEPRSGTPAFGGGAVADRTVLPDLVSVKVVGDDTVAFEFDEGVVDDPGVVDATSFHLYDSDGDISTPADAGDFEGSDTNTNVLNVLFADADVADAVGGFVEQGAVTATGDGETNLLNEQPMEDIAFTAGRTGLPDLVSVDISFDEFGDPTVAYTFDEDFAFAGAAAVDYFLVDPEGVVFQASAIDQGDDDDDNVIEATFDPDQAATAVVGAVGDAVPGTTYPEGDVTVSRDTTSSSG